MKKIFKFIGMLLILFVVASAVFGIYSSNPRVILSKLLNNGSIRTQELHYRINFLGVLPIAEATFFDKKEENLRGQRVYHLNAVASSLPCYSNFFKGSAVFDSYVDTKIFNPALFKQKIFSPGKEPADKEVIYDQVNHTMALKGEKRQILPDTQDSISAIYQIRRMDLVNRKDFEISLNTNQKNYVLKGTVQPRQIIINKKKYDTFILKGDIRRRDKNNPYHQTKITMVLLKDKENIPIYIKVFASGALINIRLIETK